jgi:hypothetical protein
MTTLPSPHASSPHLGSLILGAGIAGGLAYLSWILLLSMIQAFPTISSSSSLARSISILIRYLLTGSIALFVFMFAAVSLGLVAYSGQVLLQKNFASKGKAEISDPEP